MYIPEYQDSFISDETRLWDNQYVYDRAIAAAKETGAVLIQNLNQAHLLNHRPTSLAKKRATLSTIGSTPEADVLDAAAIIERFGIDPTDQRDPYNSETLPETGISVTRPNDSNLIHEHEPNPSTTGNPCFALGDMNIEIVNYGDDYKFNPVPDANYFSWGVKVQAYESTAFLSGDINNYDGDEDRLAGAIGHVDLPQASPPRIRRSNTTSLCDGALPDIRCPTGTAPIFPNT